MEQGGQFFAVGGWEGFGNDARGELYDPFADGSQRAGAVSFPNLVELFGEGKLVRQGAEELFVQFVEADDAVADVVERGGRGGVSEIGVAREGFLALPDVLSQLVETGRKKVLSECCLQCDETFGLFGCEPLFGHCYGECFVKL